MCANASRPNGGDPAIEKNREHFAFSSEANKSTSGRPNLDHTCLATEGWRDQSSYLTSLLDSRSAPLFWRPGTCRALIDAKRELHHSVRSRANASNFGEVSPPCLLT